MSAMNTENIIVQEGYFDVERPRRPMVSPYAYVGMVYKPDVNHSIENVLEAVCQELQVDRGIFYIKRRKPHIVQARQIGMYMIKQVVKVGGRDITDQEVADHFGFDRTTVVFSYKQVNNLMDTEPEYLEAINNIKKKLWLPITNRQTKKIA